MAIPQISLHGTDTVAHRRRQIESINDLISFRADSWRTETQIEKESGVVVINPAFPPGHVARYGAIGDNVANDIEPIKRAFLQFEAGGSAVYFEPNKTYYCGDISSASTLIAVTGVIGGDIFGNGALIRVNTTDDSAPVGLQLNDCKHIHVHGLRFTDDGAATSPISGLIAFDIRAFGSGDEDIGHITLYDCEADSAVLLLRVAGDIAGEVSTNQVNRIRNVNVIRGRCRETFYGVVFQNHGDDCHVDLHCENMHRALFYYGTSGLRANIYIKNPRGGYAQIFTKSYDRSTQNARITAFVETSISSYEFVTFEFENDTETQSITDIEVDLNCRNGVATLTPVRFLAYPYGGPYTPNATTDNHWDNIRLRGDWTGFADPILIETTQSAEGRLIVDPSLSNQLPTFFVPAGFVLLPDGATESRAFGGDLTATPISISCSRYDGQQFQIEVTVSALENTTNGSTSSMTYEKALITAMNSSSGGSVSILQTDVISTYTRSTASVISYAASGENIDVSFTAYSGANAFARVDVRHVRGFP